MGLSWTGGRSAWTSASPREPTHQPLVCTWAGQHGRVARKGVGPLRGGTGTIGVTGEAMMTEGEEGEMTTGAGAEAQCTAGAAAVVAVDTGGNATSFVHIGTVPMFNICSSIKDINAQNVLQKLTMVQEFQ